MFDVISRSRSSYTSLAEGGKNKISPNLFGIIGRRSGRLKDYKFSKAVKAANIVRDATGLDEYLTRPKKFIPKTKIEFIRLEEEKTTRRSYCLSQENDAIYPIGFVKQPRIVGQPGLF